jgi:hypothetical protein
MRAWMRSGWRTSARGLLRRRSGALGEVYPKPQVARAAFAEAAWEHGPDHAARSVREPPEEFGDLHVEERRRKAA